MQMHASCEMHIRNGEFEGKLKKRWKTLTVDGERDPGLQVAAKIPYPKRTLILYLL